MTSTTTWPFNVLLPYGETRESLTSAVALAGGFTARRDDATSPGWRFRATGSIRTRSAQVLSTWHEWVATYGGTTGFLYKASKSIPVETSTDHNPNRTIFAEAVGTGDGAEVAYPLDARHIDADTLVVRVGGVTQTSGVDYSLVTNHVAPTVLFGIAPGLGVAVTADYEFHMPVVMAAYGEARTNGAAWTVPQIVLIEERVGAHLA